MFAVFASTHFRPKSTIHLVREGNNITSTARNMTSNCNDPEAAARGTLPLLETRLHRLEFLLSGSSDKDGIPPSTGSSIPSSETLRARLNALEAGVERLKRLTGNPGTVVRDLERLCG